MVDRFLWMRLLTLSEPAFEKSSLWLRAAALQRGAIALGGFTVPPEFEQKGSADCEQQIIMLQAGVLLDEFDGGQRLRCSFDLMHRHRAIEGDDRRTAYGHQLVVDG